MKITALQPQFVTEAPPGAETSESEKTAEELRLKVVKAPPPEPAARGGGAALDQETQDGLKRLSHLIRRAKKGASTDRRRTRALAKYRFVASGGDPRAGIGTNINTSQ